MPYVAGCSCAAVLLVARVASALEPTPPPDKGSDKGQEALPNSGSEVSLLHTVIIGSSDTTSTAKPSARESAAVARAHQLDVVLSDALQDFGLTLDLSERAVENGQELTDLDLVARAAKSGRWVVYPSLDVRGGDMVFRLAGVAPGSKVVFVRTEVVKPNEVALRATVMLRDVITSRNAPGSGDSFGRTSPRTEPAPRTTERVRYAGKSARTSHRNRARCAT